jgi:D-alanine-D-alanine ligase
MNEIKSIAVVCGGDSGEYEISVKSAEVVVKNLDPTKYKAYLIFISGRDWYHHDSAGNKFQVDKNDFSILINDQKITFDAVFNAIHGTPGEDGKLLGYLDMMKIPYTSCSMVTSAMTFHKDYCKRVVKTHGVKVADSVLISKSHIPTVEEIIKTTGLPAFVKPNNGGSSVGVSKVKTAEEMMPAIEKALLEDGEVLVESFVAGREIGCGVMESKGRMIVFPITEIVSKKEFFDYEAKYTEGMSDEITPAPVDEETETLIKATGAYLYQRIGCKGFVRFDFILTPKDLYFLEVNTVPGISPASIIPKQAGIMGISLEQLFGMALENII